MHINATHCTASDDWMLMLVSHSRALLRNPRVAGHQVPAVQEAPARGRRRRRQRRVVRALPRRLRQGRGQALARAQARALPGERVP